MAPATRKLLENCFTALLDSGIDYRKQQIGCYMSGNSVELLNVARPDEYEPRGSFAGAPAMIANRISNHLDLLGPSIPVDTACSSSQTALHVAVQAILIGDCKAAVVGGCQMNHRLIDWIGYSQSGVLASDGKCKPFDAAADGFGRAEACVAIVIKPLEDALKDNDRVYATILGTSVNSTGAAGPPGAPVGESQSQAMKVAFERAGRTPSDVSYIEVHATGTAKGDPTEANWVGQQFQRPDELLIGSVKGNIGHPEIAAYLVSLSKVISIFEHKLIPPNVNLITPNPAIKWAEYNLRVPTHPTPLPAAKAGQTLISMTSSGIGGSNGHVVLEAPPEPSRLDRSEREIDGPILLMAGGLSPRSSAAIADQISDIFATAPRSEHAPVATILGRRSKQMNWRSYAVAIPGSESVQFSSTQYSGRDVNSLVFVFSGQGPQHETMGRELFSTFPVFRDSILEMDTVFRRKTNKSIIHDYGLFGPAVSSFQFPSAWPISLTLPSIAMFQMALFDLLVSLGVSPDIILGHSAGETAVLYASGAAPKAMAVELAIIRGEIFSTVESSGGTMAALSCTPTDAARLINQHKSVKPDSIVELACINSPSAVALSGQETSIDAILDLAKQEGYFGRKIRTRVPIHSSMMDVCEDRYRAEVQDLFDRYPGQHVPKIRMYSTLTGGPFAGSFDADYFWKNTRSQVLFAPAVQNITGVSTFVELAPHPVLSSYLSDMAAGSSSVFSSVQRPKKGSPSTEYRDILQFLGKLTAAGHNCVDFTILNAAACSESKTRFPAYPFLKKRFPLYPDSREANVHHGPLNRSHLKLNRDTHSTLSEHMIRGEPIWPAAGFLEMALEFGATALFNVNLRSMLPLSAEDPIPVNVTLDGSFWKVTSSIAGARTDKTSGETQGVDNLNIAEIRDRCRSHVDSEFYPSLSYFSSYGPKFRRVTNLYYNSNEAFASICGMDGSLSKETSYILHPAVLDACFQITGYRPFLGDYAPNNYYLPSRIGEIILHQPSKAAYFPPHIYAHVELSGWMPDSVHFNVTVADDSGKRLCTLRNFEVARHQISPDITTLAPLHVTAQPVFQGPREPEKLVRPPKSDTTGLYVRLDDSPDGSTEQDPCLAELVDRKHLQFDAATRALRFAAALTTSSLRLRNLISSLTSQNERVIRICIFSDVDSFISRVQEVLNEFPHTPFELSLPESCTPAGHILQPFVVIRRHDGSFPDDCYFDIVLSFGQTASSVELDPGCKIKSYDSILLPGGTIILTDVNRDAWDQGLPGTAWYSSVFDTPPRFHLGEYQAVLKQMGYSIVHSDYLPTSDPFHFTIDAQKASWRPEVSIQSALLDEDAFVFTYVFGAELQLQWDFSGLNPAQELEIWILASEGQDAAAGLCLTRALRREYLFWRMRFVSFPGTFTKAMRMDSLRALPLCLRAEPDIIFSPQGDPLVPRLVPLVAITRPQTQPSGSVSYELGPDHAVAQIHFTSPNPNFSAIVASVIQANSDVPEYQSESLVVGLQRRAAEGRAVIDLGPTCIVSPDFPISESVGLVPGLVISVLGPGIGTWKRPRRIRALSILITHCDTAMGSTVCEIYSREGIEFSQTNADAAILDLTRLGDEKFDLIISGYEDKIHDQVLRTLLRPSTGKLFLWHHELARTLREDPCSVGDALRVAVSRGFLQTTKSASAANGSLSLASNTHVDPPSNALAAVFDPNKTYVILGGIGSLGASVALFMAQRGARHIVVTSRSGKASLDKEKNVIVRRIFTYLQGLDSLDIRLEAVDAASPVAMGTLFNSLHSEIGGCLILTAMLADGLFATLGDKEFTTVFTSKTAVLETLQRTIDTSKLEFVIAFSSVTSVFGTGGQTNYCAANGALEEQMVAFANGFAFICPGIVDSAFFLSEGGHGAAHLKHLIDWSISTDEMMLWLDDAISKYQHGARFHKYIPSLDWEIMDRTHGMPMLGVHLVPSAIDKVHVASEPIVVQAARIIQNVLNISQDDFDVDVPLTSYGVDSLSAGRLSFALRSILQVTQLQLLADVSLTDIIRKFAQNSPTVEVTEVPGTVSVSTTALMDDWVRKFTDSLSQLSVNLGTRKLDEETPSSHTVLLTGSTGALGCHILAHFLADDNVRGVYALNRTSSDGVDIIDRQTTALQDQGLSPSLAYSEKLTLLVGDSALDDFGLSVETMDELLSSVTHIMHNAWKVDFGPRLSEFGDLIIGTNRLLELAMKSKRSIPPSFSFISAIGVYQNLHPSIVLAPESPIEDAKIAVRTGYGESKWVGERLVQIASQRGYLNANVIRVGQLTGSVNGSWSTTHWFPALVQSGVHIGCLPDGNDVRVSIFFQKILTIVG
ncbi:putative polyketide synthase [Mycena maculata]|uniref:Polyketide synthase n=1 Tax=Mycena maculata TaxID=230809 RepID=A0AAD7HYC0_9AGAR|nr:putative polyketide synthase [Mycena maculata]